MLRTNTVRNKHKIMSIDPDEIKEEENGDETTKNDRLELLFMRSLEPGDHIAAARRNGMYEHHGIYEGTERGYQSVIHFQGPETSLVKGSASLFCFSKCGYHHPKKGGHVISCLDCFSRGKNMFKFQYKTKRDLVSDRDPNLNQLEPGKVILGYCTKKYYLELSLGGKLYGHMRIPKEKVPDYKLEDEVRFYEMISERSSKEVLDIALKSNVEPYSLGFNNCEHFAVFCKTGLLRSIQVECLRIPIKWWVLGKLVCGRIARGLPYVQDEQEKSNQEGATDMSKKSNMKKKEKTSWSE